MRSILTVGLGNSLQLILLLDGVGGRGTLGGVDQLFSQTFSNGLDVSERGLSGTNGDQGNGGVDSSQRRDIDSLSSDGTGRTDSGGVFSGTRVDDTVNNNLKRVLASQNVDNLQSVLDDSDSLQLLTVVSAVHHQGVGQSLDDWALSLSESLGGVSAGSVRNEHWGSDLDVVDQGDVLDLDILKRPLVEQLDLLLSSLDIGWDWGGQFNQLQLLLDNWFFNLLLLLDVRHIDFEVMEGEKETGGTSGWVVGIFAAVVEPAKKNSASVHTPV